MMMRGPAESGPWAAWPARRPWLALGIAVFVALGAGWSVSRLSVGGSLETMFPADQPSARAMAVLSSRFPASENLWLRVSLPPDAPNDPAPLEAFAQRLGASVVEDDWLGEHVTSMAYRVPDEAEAFLRESALPALWLYLDEPGRRELLSRLEPASMARALARAGRAAAGPGAAGVVGQAMLRDPLRVRDLVRERFAGDLAAAAQDEAGLYLSRDRRSLLIQFTGDRPVSDMAFVKAFVGAMRDAVQRAKPGELTVGYTGAYAIAHAAERSIRADMTRSIIGSVVLLQVLFLLTYRAWWAFGVAFAPVGLGVLVAFGVFAWLGRPLSPPTAVVGAMLAGLGLDYTIHYLSHYHTADRPGPAAATHVVRTLGPTLVMACVTSVIAFGVIGLSGIPSLRDFAFIGTTGLISAWLAAFVVLPAVLSLAQRRARGRRPEAPPLGSRWRFEPILRGAIAARRVGVPALVLLAVGAALVLAWPGGVVRFSSDLAVMHPQPNEPLALQERVTRTFPGRGDALLVLLEAESHTALISKAHRVARHVEHDAAAGRWVGSVAGLHTLLPDPDAVPARRAAAAELDTDRIAEDFDAAVRASPFAPEALADYGRFLQDLLRPDEPPTVADLRRYPGLAGPLLPHDTAGSQDVRTTHHAVAVLFLKEAITTARERAEAVTAIRGALAPVTGTTLTGMSVVGHDAAAAVARDLQRLAPIAAGAVAVLLLVGFRSLRDAALALVPLAVGVLLLLAWMKLTDVRLNLVNLVAIPLLVGLGVDDGVFTMGVARSARRRGVSRGQLLRELTASAHAITMTSATTLLAFGSLMLTSTPAIRSLGQVLAAGVITCWLATVLLLCPIAHALHPRPTRPTGDHPGPTESEA